jgi:hypothetical protein
VIHDFVTGGQFEKDVHFSNLFHSIYDIKYIAKPELLPAVMSQTTIMEDMLAAFKEFHFADAYQRPRLMGEYGEEERNRKLIDLLRAVLTASPIAVKYLRAAAASPPDDLRRVLQSFVTLFARLE